LSRRLPRIEALRVWIESAVNSDASFVEYKLSPAAPLQHWAAGRSGIRGGIVVVFGSGNQVFPIVLRPRDFLEPTRPRSKGPRVCA